MYRQSLLDKEIMAASSVDNQPQFLNRVVQLPVVTTAMDQVAALYVRTKESNRLMRYTLQTAETGVHMVTKTAEPVMKKLEKPIGQLDQLACAQLEKLECRYPLITKPTDQVYGGTVKPAVDHVNAALKPTVDTVSAVSQYGTAAYSSVKQYSTDKVNGVKTFTSNKLGDVQQYTYRTVSGVYEYGTSSVEAAMSTHYGKALTKSVDSLLDITDNYVDHYLPDEKKSEDDHPVVTIESAATLARVQRLCNKLQQRMSSRAYRQVSRVQVHAQESLDKLHYTVELMHHAKTHLAAMPVKMTTMPAQLAGLPESTRDRLRELWEEINKTEEQAEQQLVENCEYPPSLERRLISTARHFTQRLKTALTIMSTSSQLLPDTVQARLKDTRVATEDLYYMFMSTENKLEGMTSMMVEQSRTYIMSISDGLSHVTAHIYTFSPLSWLIPDFNFDDIFDEDPEIMPWANGESLPLSYVPCLEAAN